MESMNKGNDMQINCKEVIETPNDDFTKRVEFIGCKFMCNGKEIEGTIVLHRVVGHDLDSLEYYPIEDNSEIFTVCIPE